MAFIASQKGPSEVDASPIVPKALHSLYLKILKKVFRFDINHSIDAGARISLVADLGVGSGLVGVLASGPNTAENATAEDQE